MFNMNESKIIKGLDSKDFKERQEAKQLVEQFYSCKGITEKHVEDIRSLHNIKKKTDNNYIKAVKNMEKAIRNDNKEEIIEALKKLEETRDMKLSIETSISEKEYEFDIIKTSMIMDKKSEAKIKDMINIINTTLLFIIAMLLTIITLLLFI